MSISQSHLSGADFIRAIACLSVLAHHLVQRLSPARLDAPWEVIHRFTLFGSFGVAGFFILSGFLLARPFWNALDAGEPMPALRIYAWRRAARIIPGFFLALSVTFVLSFTLLGAPLNWGLVVRFVSGLLLVSDWHWFTLFPVEFNGPLWSIGFEVTSYVLLPLCLMLIFAGRRLGLAQWNARALWAIIILAVLYVHVTIVANVDLSGPETGWNNGLIGGAREWMPEFNPIGFFAIFAIGAMAAGFQTMWQGFRHWGFDVLALAGLGLSIYAIIQYMPTGQTDGLGRLDIPYGFPLFPIGIALMLASLPSSKWLGAALDIQPFRFVAQISFGIYVWHFLVLELLREFAAPRFQFAGISNVPQWLWLAAAGITISFAIATASFFLMERPILRKARQMEATLKADKQAPATEVAPRS